MTSKAKQTLEVFKRTAKRTNNIEGRKQDLIPAIIYGPKQESTPAFIPLNFFATTKAIAGSTIYTLKGEVLENKPVMIREMVKNPIGNKILHVDLYAPDMEGSMAVEVSLDFQGEPFGVTEEDGVIQEVRRTIELECPVTDIPESIVVDISEMKLHDTLQIGDIKVPEKYKVLSAPEYAVINITEVKALPVEDSETEEAAVSAEGAENTEGAEAADGEESQSAEADKEKSDS